MPRRQSFRHPLPTPASPLFGPTQPAWPLARPFPLLPLAIGDFGYALYHALRHPTPLHLTALAGVRAAVLALILVPSARWRARGSWLVAASGATLIACTWEVCAAQLMRNIPDPQPVSAFYLLITAAIASFEYVFFLLLVRLVPPTHFAPFSLRGPPANDAHANMLDGVDALSPSLLPLPLSPSLTPAGVGRRPRRESLGKAGGRVRDSANLTPLFSTPPPPSSRSRGFPSPTAAPAGASYTYSPWSHRADDSILEEYDEADAADADTDDDGEHGADGYAYYDDDDGLDYARTAHGPALDGDRDNASHRGSSRATSRASFHRSCAEPGSSRFDAEMGLTSDHDHDCDYDSDGSCSSSVSDSSIIDLPRPRMQPIVAEGAIADFVDGMAGVAGAADEIAARAGELVRRSASARLLGRSAGSEAEVPVSQSSHGYGTFGRG